MSNNSGSSNGSQSSEDDDFSFHEDRRTRIKRQTESEHTAHTFPLTLRQYRYLRGKEGSRSKPKNIRKNKIERLPARFSELFNDIALLKEEDILEQGTNDVHEWNWDIIWHNITNVGPYARSSFDYFLSAIDLPEHDQQQVEFGIELGRTIKFLCEPASQCNKEMLLHGFRLGLFVDEPDVDPFNSDSSPTENISHATDLLKQWAPLVESQNRAVVRAVESAEQPDEITKQAIEHHELAVTKPLKQYLKDNVDFRRGLLPMADQQVENKAEECNDILNDLIDNSDIKVIDNVAKTIWNDLQALNQEERRGQNGREVFDKLVDSHPNKPFDELNLNRPKQAKYLVRKLAGEHKRGKRWQKRPLTKKEDAWTTTEYGNLIADIIEMYEYENIDIRERLHRYSLNPDELTEEESKQCEEMIELVQ